MEHVAGWQSGVEFTSSVAAWIQNLLRPVELSLPDQVQVGRVVDIGAILESTAWIALGASMVATELGSADPASDRRL